MYRGKNLILLSGEELSYIKESEALGADLLEILRSAEAAAERTGGVQLSRSDAELFRSAFTTHLAVVGFDAEYEPTREGKLLEELIDRFYLDSEDAL